MDSKQYQREAQVTLSHSFFGEFVSTSELIAALNEAIAACAKVDKLKKLLFYGRGADQPVRRPSESLGAIAMTGSQEATFHALIGVGTEGAECFEILRDWLVEVRENRIPVPFPVTKIMEELGGNTWYVAVGAEAMGVTIDDIYALNIAQLRARYKERFDAFEANNRNLEFESSVMKSMSETITGQPETKLWEKASVIDQPLPKADDEISRYEQQK